MSVIIRLQNLPWSANALDIRNFFRGLSIPEGGVHIVGGELGDAFIAFSTDEDARQAMMLDGGKIKEIQVRLLLSSRSEMHKVIETARQTVPILSLTAPAPAPAAPAAPTIAPVQPVAPVVPQITPFSAALGTNPLGFGIPGIGNPQEIPQPAVIEPPAPLVSPSANASPQEDGTETESKRIREKDRRRTRSRSRSRDRKDRKRDRRDRSRSRERRRRDRSRSRERRDRKRDSRKERSRSRERSPTRRSRDRREKNPRESLEKSNDAQFDNTVAPPAPAIANMMNAMPGQQSPLVNTMVLNGQMPTQDAQPTLYNDPGMSDAFNKLQELGKKRNPNAFQGDPPNGNGNSNRFQGGRSAGNSFRREGRPSRFETSDNARDVCVAIRNAPNHTSYGDVRRFFPFLIDKHGIKMINDNMGRRTGNIFVKFCDPRSKQLALQRRNNVLKEVQVTVESLPDDAYDAAVDSFLPYREDNDDEEPILIIGDKDGRPPQSVLKLTDLPNFVKEHDIIKSFSEFSLLSITLVDCRATRTKTAFVQFVKPEDAKQAYDNKDKYLFGRRHPTITPLTLDEFEKEKNEKVQEQPPMLAAKEQAPEPVVPRDPRQRRQQLEGNSPKVNPQLQAAQAGAPQFFGAPFVPQQNFSGQFVPTQFGGFPAGLDPRMAAANWAARPGFADQIGALQMGNAGAARVDLDDEPLDCVLMKGLPREATDRTIVNFLSDTGAVPSRIHLMLDGNGLPSGDCFCEFRATQEARMAATKHGSNLEGCRVTVDLVTRSVVEEALEGPKQPEPMNILGNVPAIPQYYEAPQSVPPRGGYMARGPYRGGRGGYDSSRGFDSNRGFDSSRGFDRGGYRGGFDSSRGNYRGRGGFERGGRGFERGRGGRGFGGRGRGVGGGAAGGGFEGRERDDELDPALEDFGAPGCVVSMENVPFRASIDDIMSFFSEFDLTQDDVIRRYNERGQPTGDARVAFRTPFDAQRAVKTRHMDTIHDRRITLTIL